MPLFLRRPRTMKPGAFALRLTLFLVTPLCATSFASAAVTVRSVDDPQMTSVVASTRNATLAAAKLIGSGVSPQVFDDIALIDASVLETPLDATEQAAARDTIAAQYRQNPQGFMKSLDVEHKLAQALQHGSASEQAQVRAFAWLGWLIASQSSPYAARWVATVRRHNAPIATAGNLVVTNRQLDAYFASNDWVAHAANLPVSTQESRAAFTQALPQKFASMTQIERTQLAIADVRWYAFRQVLGFGLQDKASQIARQNVHGPNDVAPGARHLEDAAIEFDRGTAKLNRQLQQGALALMGGSADGMVNHSINSAQDRFEGKFDANPHH